MSPALPEMDRPRPFLDHLAELRRTLLQSLAILTAAVAASAAAAPWILAFLKRPLNGVVADPETFLTSYEIAAGFLILVRVSFSAGILLAAPWILVLAWRFVLPGLTFSERRSIGRYMPAAVAMFFTGAAFAYLVILPLALRVMLQLHQWMGIQVDRILVTDYTTFVTRMLLSFGAAFEMPVVLLILGRLGIVSAAQLRARRRHVAVALMVVAMLMTPQDIASQLLMALPLMALYEICILLISRGGRAVRA